MKRLLLTGMSGVGKSTLILELRARGFRAVDLEEDGYCRWIDSLTGLPATPPEAGHPLDGRDYIWDEDAVERLLSSQDAEVLFVSGSASNQVRFYNRFDAIVLLSVPRRVLVDRLSTRATNSFGKQPADLARALTDLDETEPRLRRAAGYEVDTSGPIEKVVEAILDIALPR